MTHTNHVARTSNSVHTVSSNPGISEEEVTGAYAGSSSFKEDDWDTVQATLNILFKNPQNCELKSIPSSIRDYRVFTLDKYVVPPVDSAKADDTGSYIYKGNPKKYYRCDVENAPRCCHHGKLKNCWVVKERDLTRSSNFVDIIVDESEVYEIKRPYRQNKYDPWLNNVISQVKPVSCLYQTCIKPVPNLYETCIKSALPPLLSEDAVAPPFIMPRHGNATNPEACAYYELKKQ